jgi:hypothetical protein
MLGQFSNFKILLKLLPIENLKTFTYSRIYFQKYHCLKTVDLFKSLKDKYYPSLPLSLSPSLPLSLSPKLPFLASRRS